MLQPLFGFNWFGIPIYFVFLAIALLIGVKVLRKQQNGKIYGKLALVATIALSLSVANISSWFLFPDMRFVPVGMRFSIGTMFFHAGMLSFFGLSILFRIKNNEWKQWIHEAVPAFIIFSFFERIGAILAGHGYGIQLSTEGIPFALFPAREIEALVLLIMYFIFRQIKQHRFSLYLLSYSVLRFALEFGRGDDRGRLFIDALSPSQITSIFIWLGLITYIIIRIVQKSKTAKDTSTETEGGVSFIPREPFVSIHKGIKKIAGTVVVLVSLVLAVIVWFNPFNSDVIYTFGRSVGDFSRQLTNNGRSATWVMAEERYASEFVQLIRSSWSDNFFGHIIFTIDENYMMIDGSVIEIETAPTISNGTIMLPIHDLIEAIGEVNNFGNAVLIPLDTIVDEFGMEAEWNAYTQEIFLTREFQSRRLIVNASHEIDFTVFGATKILDIPESTMSILQFASIHEAIYAYNILSLFDEVTWVDVDSIIFSSSINSRNLQANHNHNIPLSWGVNDSGLSQYAEYLHYSGIRGTIVVAVLDTGFDGQHSFFEARRIAGWRDFSHNGWRNANDFNGHGTHVAGTIVDSTPRLDVRLYNVKVLTHSPSRGNPWGSSGSWTQIGNGVRHAVNNNVNVINMSLGGAGGSNFVQSEIDRAINNGITVVAAAMNCGNGGRNECQFGRDVCRGHANQYFPANLPNVITVAATDRNQQPAWFSNRNHPNHSVVNIAAPGVSIVSTVPFVRDSSGFYSMPGTSMATPHVAAAVAMYKIANPETNPVEMRRSLQEHYRFVPNAWDVAFGAGILDMSVAIPGSFLQPLPYPTHPTDRPSVMAEPISARVLVDGVPVLRNGVEVAIPAYNIHWYTSYFRLRDLAYALSHTPARFSVTWVEADNSIRVIREAEYISLGNELISESTGVVEAVLTQQSIFVDGFAVDLQAYNIRGYNYFMLRELGTHLFFDVDWDAVTNSILIITERRDDGQLDVAQDAPISDTNEAGILDGRFVRADGVTGVMAGFPWVEFRGNQFEIPLAGGVGGVSVASNYTFHNGNLTFQLDGVNVTWRLEIINVDSIRLDFGVGIFIDFVRYGSAPGVSHDVITIPSGRFVRADGMTGVAAGYPWIEFTETQITIPLMGGIGGISVTSNFTQRNGNITFQLEGANVTWRIDITNNNAIMVDFGISSVIKVHKFDKDTT